ncbi:MAG TPA: hypothetical protein VMW86_00385 [Dehalococcoidales bacterium]|nr:hypothetical protein [Dehalococcoidales bacterium]
MGFWNFLKKIFGSDDDDAELQAARARHGIKIDVDVKGRDKDEETYDPWDDIRNFRTNFWLGNWVNRKFRIIGEEKVKKELAELEKKREEERKQKEGEGEKL